MTCGPQQASFRLLDAYVGWDPAFVEGVTGLADPDGIRLAPLGSVHRRQELLPWFPDRRLAPGCEPCDWYLKTSRRQVCGGGFGPIWECAPPPRRPVAVAAAGHWLALAERHGPVRVWWREGEQLVAEIPVDDPRVIAVTARGETYVAREGSTDLWRYRAGGAPAGRIRTRLPGRVEGLRIGRDRTLWLLTESSEELRIWRGPDFQPATLDELAAAFKPSTLESTWDGGFCLRETGPDGDLVESCYDWDGHPLDSRPPAPPRLVTDGELATRALDSGLPRCRWHRVSLSATVPAGTAVRVAVAVTEERDTVLDPGDWQEAPGGALDFLVDQPPGRYLHLRLGLSGDGTATPVVRRIRLDFPRSTSADLLPPAFRTDPAADDFTERFLSLFDSSLADIDRVIERYPALLDAQGVPDRALPWLGGLLGLAFEGGWSAEVRRELIANAPELFRRRGTPWAVREAVRIVAGVEPVIEELAQERNWLRLGAGGRLGLGRLFGRSAARFRVGTSALSGAPIRGHGDPYTDPLSQHAYRFRVALPPRTATTVDDDALRRLVASQAPAHTAGSVRRGGLGWVVGVWSAVGVDTAFAPLPAPVLGPAGTVRLGRSSVLAASRKGPHRGVAVGERSTVGVGLVAW